MDWLTPTRRIVRWSPLLLASALALSMLATIRLSAQPLGSVELMISLTIVVIGALCGLHDPARDLVHATPVPASRRLTHRLLLIVPALALALAVVRGAAGAWFVVQPPAPGWAALAAFGSVGVAVCTMCARRLGARAVDVAVPGMLAWLAVAVLSDQFDAPFGLAMPWWRFPLAVASIAVPAIVIATTRGAEA